MADDLVTLGGAHLKLIGLRPTRLSRRSEVGVPGASTFRGMVYQDTGIRERTAMIEARTLPHVFGGMDALSVLEGIHFARKAVQYLRMTSNFRAVNQGLVVVRSLDVDEENLHPADGVGREVTVSAELVYVDELTHAFGES